MAEAARRGGGQTPGDAALRTKPQVVSALHLGEVVRHRLGVGGKRKLLGRTRHEQLGRFIGGRKRVQQGRGQRRRQPEDQDRAVGRAACIKQRDAVGVDFALCFFAHFARPGLLPSFAQLDKAAGQTQLALLRLVGAPNQQQAPPDRHQHHRDRQRVDIADIRAGGAAPGPGLVRRVGRAAIRAMGVFGHGSGLSKCWVIGQAQYTCRQCFARPPAANTVPMGMLEANSLFEKDTLTMKLQNKVAIITGAATGIGQAIAIAMAREGANVVVDYVGSPDAPKDTVQQIQSAAGKALAVAADVSQPDQVANLIAQTVAQFGKLDIFVNNAGIEKKMPFLETPIDVWNKVIAVDLTGPFLCAQAAAKQMVVQGSAGRIINISSVHEDLPMPTNAPYCAAKGGLRMLTRTIAVELAPHNITVNNIGPGAIYTPIDADIQAQPEVEKQLMAEIPLGRWGKPEEVAGLAVFLASDDAAYMTGSTYFIDGGMLRMAGSL